MGRGRGWWGGGGVGERRGEEGRGGGGVGIGGRGKGQNRGGSSDSLPLGGMDAPVARYIFIDAKIDETTSFSSHSTDKHSGLIILRTMVYSEHYI